MSSKQATCRILFCNSAQLLVEGCLHAEAMETCTPFGSWPRQVRLVGLAPINALTSRLQWEQFSLPDNLSRRCENRPRKNISKDRKGLTKGILQPEEPILCPCWKREKASCWQGTAQVPRGWGASPEAGFKPVACVDGYLIRSETHSD